jgi:hypothetical protein
MQAQLAALHAAAAGTGPAAPPQAATPAGAAFVSTSPSKLAVQADAQSMQPILALPPATSAAAAAAGGVVEQQLACGSSSSQGMVQLQDALAAAEQHLAVLTDENERLMELSNSLRAENEQLKRSQQVRIVPRHACQSAAVCVIGARAYICIVET